MWDDDNVERQTNKETDEKERKVLTENSLARLPARRLTYWWSSAFQVMLSSLEPLKRSYEGPHSAGQAFLSNGVATLWSV